MKKINILPIPQFLERGAFVSVSPEEWVIGWGEIQLKDGPSQQETSFYVSEFLEESGEWLQFSNSLRLSTEELKDILNNYDDELIGSSPIERSWEEPQKNEFLSYFKNFKNDLGVKKISKVVPVVFAKSSSQFQSFEKLAVLKKLLSLPEGVHAYGFWQNQQGLVGASPEVLIQRKGFRFKTMALAGTSKKENSSLLKDRKEMSEHQFVINDISQKLNDCDLSWEETKEWKIGNLKHLKSLASGVSTKSINELISALHPTSALGGAPGRLPLRYLANFCNSEKRRYFGAPFGVSHKGEDLILVALRNIQWFDGTTYLGSGCGLVEQSEFEKEWQELKLKRDFTKGYLNL